MLQTCLKLMVDFAALGVISWIGLFATTALDQCIYRPAAKVFAVVFGVAFMGFFITFFVAVGGVWL